MNDPTSFRFAGILIVGRAFLSCRLPAAGIDELADRKSPIIPGMKTLRSGAESARRRCRLRQTLAQPEQPPVPVLWSPRRVAVPVTGLLRSLPRFHQAPSMVEHGPHPVLQTPRHVPCTPRDVPHMACNVPDVPRIIPPLPVRLPCVPTIVSWPSSNVLCEPITASRTLITLSSDLNTLSSEPRPIPHVPTSVPRAP